MPVQLPKFAYSALIGCAILLALGILPLPYGYYSLLRLTALVAFGVVAYVAVATRSWPTLAISVSAAMVFNPFVPIRLPNDAWACIDAGAAAYLAVVASHLVSGFSKYSFPDQSVEAVARTLGFALLLGLFAGVGVAVAAGMVVIPLKWFGLAISSKFMNPLAYGAATAAAVAVVTGHAYHSGTKAHAQSDA